MQGQNYQVDKEPLLAIPLCVPRTKEQARIAAIVQQYALRARPAARRSSPRLSPTVEDWELGRRTPTGAAQTLLKLAFANPHARAQACIHFSTALDD
jgi:DNA-binding transcriptional regulator YiaG